VYEEDGTKSVLRPDFVFFTRAADGKIVADIVDPHGAHLSDALPKLKALATYAEEHSASVRRVESIAVLGGVYKVLDLTEANVRSGVNRAVSATALYESALATDFVV
jgi:hypothetical protein